MDTDIKIMRELLELRGRKDLSDLLDLSRTKLNYYSVNWTDYVDFQIFSPTDRFDRLNNLDDADRKLITTIVHEIHPQEHDFAIDSVEILIDRDLYKSEEAQINTTLEKVVPPKSTDQIKVFISFNTDDITVAEKVHSILHDHGFLPFLAHREIIISEDWRRELLKSLRSTDILIPLVTKNFDRSEYTNQEVGYAMAYGISIFTICIDSSPTGFLKDNQLITLDTASKTFSLKVELNKILDRMIQLSIANGKFSNRFRRSVIDLFCKSGGFALTRDLIYVMREFESFSETEANRILNAASKNDQIYKYPKSGSFVKEIYSEYQESVDEKIRSSLAQHFLFVKNSIE